MFVGEDEDGQQNQILEHALQLFYQQPNVGITQSAADGF